MRQLKEKHPDAQRAKLGSLLFGPVEDIPDSVYQGINGELVREAALRTKGSGGPSGVDANGFKRILACKSFKRSSINLCESIATLTRRLCTEFVDPLTIEPIAASRLIPLGKGNGEVCPIGVGVVIRRITGKCITRVPKQDVINASGAMQDMDFDINKREFQDAVRLRYDWPIPDNPSVCVCGSMFTVDHAMICQRGGLVIQRHNEIRDLQAELLDMVCYDVQVEPALQPITGEELARGTNQAPDARLDIHCRGFWE